MNHIIFLYNNNIRLIFLCRTRRHNCIIKTYLNLFHVFTTDFVEVYKNESRVYLDEWAE